MGHINIFEKNRIPLSNKLKTERAFKTKGTVFST